jgi:tRNA pseudouridine38-40 synthase
MAAVRRSLGFHRYALSLQYHGSSFLGFSSQGDREDCISPDGTTDLRGFRSVERRLTQALGDFLGEGDTNQQQFENVQVSSRTDRGVHALKNTCHVDIRTDMVDWSDRLHRGLNSFLRNQKRHSSQTRRLGDRQLRDDPMNELRVLNVKLAPTSMANPWHFTVDPTQPATVDWNARFSATQRTYLYRVLHSTGGDTDWAAPFEWDRSWRTYSKSKESLDVAAMQLAASYLVGEHDFSSFRGKGCQRSSPIVHLRDVQVHAQPYDFSGLGSVGAHQNGSDGFVPGQSCQLVTLQFRGNAFLYRQVRNLTGCLVEVGRKRLSPSFMLDLLAARDRSLAPTMAPPHGLFLMDVQHGDFEL